MLADTLRAKARAVRGEGDTVLGRTRNAQIFSPLLASSAPEYLFFFPRVLGASLHFVLVCWGVFFVCLFSPQPSQIKLPLKKQTWNHSRSPPFETVLIFSYVYLVLLFRSLGGAGRRGGELARVSHPDVREEDKCLQPVSFSASSAAASVPSRMAIAASVPHGDRSPCLQHPSALTNS